jgi:hypothetical protein
MLRHRGAQVIVRVQRCAIELGWRHDVFPWRACRRLPADIVAIS